MSEIFGIRSEGDHWRCFGDGGNFPGLFADREAARWGTWAETEDIQRINGEEGRLITMDDLRECMTRRARQADAALKPDRTL